MLKCFYNVKETYIGPLDKIVEFYVSIGGAGAKVRVSEFEEA